jgi:hypothetical protein
MNRYIMSGRGISDKYPPRDYATFRSDCREKFSFKTGILLSLQISSKTWSICLLTSNIIQKTCWIISTTLFLIPSVFNGGFRKVCFMLCYFMLSYDVSLSLRNASVFQTWWLVYELVSNLKECCITYNDKDVGGLKRRHRVNEKLSCKFPAGGKIEWN